MDIQTSIGSALLVLLAAAPLAAQPLQFSDAQLEAAWQQLDRDGVETYLTMRRLSQADDRAAEFLASRLSDLHGFIVPPDAADLVTRLGDPKWAIREQATAELAAMMPLHRTALEEAAKRTDSAEVRARVEMILKAARPASGDKPAAATSQPAAPARLQRAIWVLMQMRSPRARELTKLLEQGKKVQFKPRHEMADLPDDSPPATQPAELPLGATRYVGMHPSMGTWWWIGNSGEKVEPLPAAASAVWGGASACNFSRQGANIKVLADASSPGADAAEVLVFSTGDDWSIEPSSIVEVSTVASETPWGPVTFKLRHQGRLLELMAFGRVSNAQGAYRMDYGAAVEAHCRFGERVLPVRILDTNMNLRFDNVPQPDVYRQFTGQGQIIGKADSLLVDIGAGDFSDKAQCIRVYLGQPIEVDGKLYHVTLSADESQMQVSPCDEPTAMIVSQRDSWYGVFVGDKYVLNLTGGKEKASPLIPAGTYKVIVYGASQDEVRINRADLGEITFAPGQQVDIESSPAASRTTTSAPTSTSAPAE